MSLSRVLFGISIVPFLGSCAWLAQKPPPDIPETRPAAAALSVPFVPNHGQHDNRVAFSASGRSGTVFVTHDGAVVYALAAPGADAVEQDSPPGWSLVERFASTHQELPQGVGLTPTRVSYFRGKDPNQWRRGLPTYESLTLGELWPGVRVSLRVQRGQVEKLFTLAAGATAKDIRVELHGATRLRLGSQGELRADAGLGSVRFSKPIAFQETGAARREVEVAYVLHGSAYGFALGPHDETQPVIIDPVLNASFMGGSDNEGADTEVAFSAAGDLYVAGYTRSVDFPGTTGGVQPAFAGGTFDGFVALVSSDLTVLQAVTYLGGTAVDRIHGLVLSPDGSSVYVAGMTGSVDFPGTAAGAIPSAPADRNGFIAQLSSGLNSLITATYLGGSDFDEIRVIRLQPGGTDLYVGGDTCSTDFPAVSGGARPSLTQCDDVFVSRVSADLTSIVQSTYYGGTGDGDPQTVDDGMRSGLAIHPSTGDVYLVGFTSSLDLPGTAGGAQAASLDSPSDPNRSDAFLARFSGDLTALIQATYLGGSGFDAARELLIHPTTGDIYTGGQEFSPDFPGLTGAQPNSPAGGAWVVRLSQDLTQILSGTRVSGEVSTGGTVRDFALHPVSGELYVAGQTSAEDHVGTASGAHNIFNVVGHSLGAGTADTDAFVSRLKADLSQVFQSTYLGGSSGETPFGVGDLLIHPTSGEVYVFGETFSPDFPDTGGGFQPGYAGDAPLGAALDSGDLFIVRLDSTLSGPDTTANPFTLTDVGPVPLNALVTSDPIAMTGIVAPAQIAVLNGEYSVNVGVFTREGGIVNNGDSVRVRQRSAPQAASTADTVLYVGGMRDTFTSTTSSDVDPFPFGFASQSGVPTGAIRASNSIRISGMQFNGPISIADGTYSINGRPFVSSAGFIANGERVRVRQLTAAAPLTSKTTVLTIGGVSGSFTTTTGTRDTTPDAFSFTSLSNVPRFSVQTSNAVTITGINAPVRIAIAGGVQAAYQINGGPFTNRIRTVNAGDVVRVRVRSSQRPNGTASTFLTVGGVRGEFRVQTAP